MTPEEYKEAVEWFGTCRDCLAVVKVAPHDEGTISTRDLIAEGPDEWDSFSNCLVCEGTIDWDGSNPVRWS